jgi:hypothetical protein
MRPSTGVFSLVVLCASLGAAGIACQSTDDDGVSSESALGVACACDVAGKLTLYAIPPAVSLDWSSPNKLLKSTAASMVAGKLLVSSGKAALGHEVGHVNLELDCGDLSIPLTGQTGGGSEWKSGVDGLGVLLRDFPGSLTEVPGSDHDDMVRDIERREASGLLTRITFTVNRAMCARLKSFHDEYVARGAYVHYSGLDRARRFEGAGCAIFGAGFVDVGGLLRRSLFTPAWARSVFIGSSRYSNFLGRDAFYAFGSNTVARDADGKSWVWPRGVNIPASTFIPRFPGSSTYDTWSGPEDKSLNLPSLPPELQTKVPFSIYDPQLMAEWAENVWQEATQKGSADAFGVKWKASTVNNVHEVTYDASCVAPQTIAFDADNDDLYKDSDAP